MCSFKKRLEEKVMYYGNAVDRYFSYRRYRFGARSDHTMASSSRPHTIIRSREYPVDTEHFKWQSLDLNSADGYILMQFHVQAS